MSNRTMEKMLQLLTRLYLRFTGFSYTNLARLFMRLFVGVMFLQFGIRQINHFETIATAFPEVFGMSSQCSLTVLITIELLCSLLIMVGFLTRLATVPSLVAMIIGEVYILEGLMPTPHILGSFTQQPGYIPIMFSGIFLFILLAGPGKISVDYVLSLFIISRQGRDEKEELEEV